MGGERTDKSMTAADVLFNFARRRLERNPAVSLFRAGRAAVHFGSWRVVPQFLIRRLRRVIRADSDGSSLLGSLDACAIAEEVHQNSVALAGILPLDFVSRLRAVTDRLPVEQYELMHYVDENVRLLSEDPGIKSVLRAYLGCEPVLLESNLLVTKPHPAHAPLDPQNMFHFDYAGWKSLNVFVYLTDVTPESSHHVVIKGSHRSVGIRDMLRATLADDEALRRFGPSIQSITGPAGTLFFENTEAFHKRHTGNTRRVMLNMLYASHRSWLSHGRTSRRHIEYRAQVYDLYRRNAGTSHLS
jgi:hypothetical protein